MHMISACMQIDGFRWPRPFYGEIMEAEQEFF